MYVPPLYWAPLMWEVVLEGFIRTVDILSCGMPGTGSKKWATKGEGLESGRCPPRSHKCGGTGGLKTHSPFRVGRRG